jgi:hypothetical protein
MGKFGRTTAVGLSLVILGLALLLICCIPVTSIEEAIDASFTVSSGTVYGSPNAGTSYHTRINFKGVLGKSVLRGEVFTEGEGIRLIVHGYNAQHLTDTRIEGGYSFVIDPADDLYTFAFQNDGLSESVVHFTLEEIWSRPLAAGSPAFLIAGLVAFSLFATGLVILVVIYPRRRWYTPGVVLLVRTHTSRTHTQANAIT